MSLVSISRKLSKKVDALSTSSAAAFTYNPLRYARVPHEKYLTTWGQGPKRAVLLGMNPGPFGMAQTGVPFGDIALVRDFLGITGKVGKPEREHPKRIVEGFDCPKSEVSGTRLWGFFRDYFNTPEAFFKDFFVVNYCPLVFMEESGKNLTPDKLPTQLRTELNAVCDEALLATVRELSAEWVIGVGGYARKQAERALTAQDVHFGTILHPSPASPMANRGWAPQAEKQLKELSLL